MQARRYWPPTKHKLFYANLIVYSVVVVLLVAFHNELIWSQKALRGFLFTGSVPPSADRLLVAEALRGARKKADIRHLQQLFERAVQIEPYSEARLMLGYCYLVQGESDKMLTCCDQYRTINPSHIDIYKYMIKILEEKQDRKAAEQLLMEGISHFRRRIELYRPHYDPNVPKVFNQKALRIYKEAQEGLKFLEKTQEQLKDSK